MASLTAPKPNYRCMFRCREQFIRPSGAFAIRDCNQAIVLFSWFILFLRCMLQDFVNEIIKSFFFKLRNSRFKQRAWRAQFFAYGPLTVTNEEQRTWNTQTANLDDYDACGFRLLIEIWKNVLTQSWPSLRWISVCDVKNRRNSGTHVPSDGSHNQTSITFSAQLEFYCHKNVEHITVNINWLKKCFVKSNSFVLRATGKTLEILNKQFLNRSPSQKVHCSSLCVMNSSARGIGHVI